MMREKYRWTTPLPCLCQSVLPFRTPTSKVDLFGRRWRVDDSLMRKLISDGKGRDHKKMWRAKAVKNRKRRLGIDLKTTAEASTHANTRTPMQMKFF